MRLVSCFLRWSLDRPSLASAWLLAGILFLQGGSTAWSKACVWKVTDNAGHTLYLAGSVHALRPSDYPLPPEYVEAFNASAGLSFETDETATGEQWAKGMEHASRLPDGVTLKDRLDPRTYAYIQKVVTKFNGSAEPLKRLDHLKPWFIAQMLDSPAGNPKGLNPGYGVESYLVSLTRKNHKKMDGLETMDEHFAVLGDMSDTDSEASLLLAFIQLDQKSAAFNRIVAAWKRGDTDAIDRELGQEYQSVPSLRRRMLYARNERWLPKIDGYLRSGKTWMVVAGAGHMSGDRGVPTLLRARGFQVEQL